MMKLSKLIEGNFKQRNDAIRYRDLWQKLHLDIDLLFTLGVLITLGLVLLYSASTHNNAMIIHQLIRIAIAAIAMFCFAQISPKTYQSWAMPSYLAGVALLIIVLIIGHIGKGAQRWLDLGVIRFQPSEILKLSVPILIAHYFSSRTIPPKLFHLIMASILILIPGLLIIKQPDLGTALMVMFSGGCVILFAGIQWRIIISGIGMMGIAIPILWHHMHEYQRQRLLTFINPEQDPLGTGYHIIQSKIAIGSGGLFGKGWLKGSQSNLNFLPEHTTDFIFAVCGEEFGLIGSVVLLLAYLAVIVRCFQICASCEDHFTKLLTGGLTLSFFMSVFVNVGMVTGILPVVGLPLPLVSFGGTSMVTLMAGFGIIMSAYTHRKFVT